MKLLPKYFPNIDQEQLLLFQKLEEEIIAWNSKINLISRKDVNQLQERHILHSLSIAAHIQFQTGTKILDVGTGGGFPGLPLAIMFPNVSFTLVDSIQKKIKVVRQIIDSLGLKNVQCIQERAENINKPYDFVVSRAVTSFPKFLDWTRKIIHKQSVNDIPNGILYLKGGDLSIELSGLEKSVQKIPLSNYFEEVWFKEKYIVYWKPDE